MPAEALARQAPSGRMDDAARHWFVDGRGTLLPGRREAFPRGEAHGIGRLPAGQVPDLVWVRLPEDEPLTALRHVQGRLGDVSLVALSSRPREEEALACLGAGARGYCNAHAQPVLLRRAARVVLHGGLWVGEVLVRRVLRAFLALPLKPPAAWGAALDAREQGVAVDLAAGLSVEVIGRRHGLGHGAARLLADSIFERLGARDRVQLALRIREAASRPR